MKARVVVVGAGPAGMAAAVSAAGTGAAVTVVDDNPAPGGQIWRGERNEWRRRLESCGARILTGVAVSAVDAGKKAILAGSERLEYDRLILATGARELFLPFPGWTLSGVMGAGGLQAMVKGGLPVAGKRVVIAGSGPLLLAVAAYLKKQGADVSLIGEQAPREKVRALQRGLIRFPGKLAQAARLKLSLAGVRYATDCWVEAAEGVGRVERVLLRREGLLQKLDCDYLGAGFGLWPNTELAELAGCHIRDGFVEVDEIQQTSVSDVYCAGEPTGIGGVDVAVLEGQAAGLARQVEMGRAREFARLLNGTFLLREEVKRPARADTVVCRCESVALGALGPFTGWREAKLQTRCGMGLCQGRVCGPAVETLLGWKRESTREPAAVTRVANLIELWKGHSSS